MGAHQGPFVKWWLEGTVRRGCWWVRAGGGELAGVGAGVKDFRGLVVVVEQADVERVGVEDAALARKGWIERGAAEREALGLPKIDQDAFGAVKEREGRALPGLEKLGGGVGDVRSRGAREAAKEIDDGAVAQMIADVEVVDWVRAVGLFKVRA